jgi:hypothetical protein
MEFAQLSDRVSPRLPADPMDVVGLVGRWTNSNPDTNGIARLEIAQDNGKLSLRVYAIGSPELVDWGETPITVYASGPTARTGAGFTCVFDFGFAEKRMQGMIMKGLLVLNQFHSFKDDSGRCGYFVREYFGLDHGRY